MTMRESRMARTGWGLPVLGLVAGLLGLGEAQGASGTLGDLSVVVYGSSDVHEVTDPLAVSDNLQVSNSTSHADANHSASMASALVSGQVSAVADPANVLYASASAAVERVYVVEELWFHVPANTLDPVASFQAMTFGHLQAEGCRNNSADPAFNQCSNGLAVVTMRVEGARGNDLYSRRVEVSAGGVAAAPVNDLFALDVPLLGPGETYPFATDWKVQVTGQVVLRGSALNTYSWPLGAEYTGRSAARSARPFCRSRFRRESPGPRPPGCSSVSRCPSPPVGRCGWAAWACWLHAPAGAADSGRHFCPAIPGQRVVQAHDLADDRQAG